MKNNVPLPLKHLAFNIRFRGLVHEGVSQESHCCIFVSVITPDVHNTMKGDGVTH